jgi:iron(III) transport system ATP-binding protein
VLLLDEPLSNLDAKLRVQMRRELIRLHRRLGITTLFVTHDQEEAMTICDRIAVLDQGVIQQIGTPVELFDRPSNRFVAGFVGTVNLFEGTLERDGGGARLRSPALGDIPLPQDLAKDIAGRVEIAFRPHAVSFEPGGATHALAVDGVIEAGEFLGEFMRYEVRVGSALVVADQPHRRGGALLGRGEKVRLTVPSREIRVIVGP